MSDATAFWAAGKEIVASVRTPTPTPSTPTTPASAIQSPTIKAPTTPTPITPLPTIADASPKGASEPSTQQSKGLVPKSKTNDPKPNGLQNGNWVVLTAPVSQTTLVYKTAPAAKRTCWADEEEDDETFFTQFATQPKQSEVLRLEIEIAEKEEYVKELEATLATKTIRIAELEGAINERDAYIDDLEHDIKRKDNEIEDLKQKNHEQYVEIQELHCEAGDKDDHIKRAEAKFEQVPTMQNITSPILHSGSSTTSDDTKVSFEIIKMPEAEVALPKTPESTKTSKVDAALPKAPEPIKSEGTIDMQKTGAVRGPAFSDSTSPTFVTKDTLKEVPPVPKPKTLSFPIDLSRYSKKPAASPTASPAAKLSPTSKTVRNGQTTPRVPLSKPSRTKTDVKPILKPLADIRKMSFEERALFGNGPDVTVKLGDIELKTLPQYILMQCSSKAMEYFKANPKAASWNFPEGSMDAEAAKAFLNWMHEMTYQGRVYSVTLNTSPAKDEKNLRLCRTARVLGVNNLYIGHFTKLFCDRIRAKNISYATMSAICEQSYPDNDPVLDCLANNLVDWKFRGSEADKAVAEKLAAEHPVLKAKMDSIERKARTTRRK